MNKETFIDRLYALVPQRGSVALDILREEMNNEQTEKERNMRERMPDETVWYAAHMESVPRYDPVNFNLVGYADKVTSTDTITLRQLPAYARQHGVDEEKLRAVLEGRAKEIKTKDGERLRGWPFVYVNHEMSQEDKDRWEADNRAGVARNKAMQTRQEHIKSVYPTERIEV